MNLPITRPQIPLQWNMGHASHKLYVPAVVAGDPLCRVLRKWGPYGMTMSKRHANMIDTLSSAYDSSVGDGVKAYILDVKLMLGQNKTTSSPRHTDQLLLQRPMEIL